MELLKGSLAVQEKEEEERKQAEEKRKEDDKRENEELRSELAVKEFKNLIALDQNRIIKSKIGRRGTEKNSTESSTA